MSNELKNFNLLQHQKEGLDFVIQNNGIAALFWSIGLGKTLGGISSYFAMRQKTPDLKLIVFCPTALIEGAWGEDIKKFTNYTYVNLRKAKKITTADIYIINYESLISKNRFAMLATVLSNNITMAILDESSYIKTYNAGRTKKLLAIRDYFKYRIVMSGTPAPNSDMEYWAQMRFINRDIFHKSFGAFRNTYFHLERDGKTMPANGMMLSRAGARDILSKGWKYTISPENRRRLIARIMPYCHWRKLEECIDLPPQIDETRLITMGPNQTRIYKDMHRHAVAEIRSTEIAATVAVTKLMKLRQATSGFMMDSLGEVQGIGENPKMNELMNVLEEAGDQQIIIWANFRHEIATIMEALKGESAASLYGGTPNKDEIIEGFKTKKIKYLVANPHSCGHGLTFTNCSLQVFYSLDYSWESYTQARGRTHRFGQKSTCIYIHLLCEESIDVTIYEVLKRKGDAQELVREFLREG
jgi:SNF2 family DNA or RNA helicase